MQPWVLFLSKWELPSHSLTCQLTSSGFHILWPSSQGSAFLSRAESTRLMPALEIWNSASIPWSGLPFWLTDQLICLCLILSTSCTTRMTPRRPPPASSSRALLPRPRPVRPASRARARPARRLPPWQQQQQLRRHRGRGVRGMPRHLHLLMPPLNWEQQLQHPVCALGIFHLSNSSFFFS